MDSLVAPTTLLHFAGLYWSPTPTYSIILSASTATSFAWHLTNEKNTALTFLDYSFAGIWFMYDMYLGYPVYEIQRRVWYANYCIFILNISVEYFTHADRLKYSTWHSVWHILSAIKVFYVAHLLSHIV